MHTSDRRASLEGERLEDLPEFDLRYLFDDGERPSSVTIYAPESLETTWITADADVAMPLDELR
ncbi:hypothetical protein [Halobaculum lipolyticum]|uniref:Uncharacterized protein n=1 Tax=Halobaculum lipolyticum TaxID=3032001 RepID=A0ABD5WIS0_9EURY|nr:hypothetical protein [Halobaculum sp. DT31]